MNNPEFPAGSKAIAERYGWEPHRFNPAANYLFERGLLRDAKILGDREFEQHRTIGKEDELRRFLRSRQ